MSDDDSFHTAECRSLSPSHDTIVDNCEAQSKIDKDLPLRRRDRRHSSTRHKTADGPHAHEPSKYWRINYPSRFPAGGLGNKHVDDSCSRPTVDALGLAKGANKHGVDADFFAEVKDTAINAYPDLQQQEIIYFRPRHRHKGKHSTGKTYILEEPAKKSGDMKRVLSFDYLLEAPQLSKSSSPGQIDGASHLDVASPGSVVAQHAPRRDTHSMAPRQPPPEPNQFGKEVPSDIMNTPHGTFLVVKHHHSRSQRSPMQQRPPNQSNAPRPWSSQPPAHLSANKISPRTYTGPSPRMQPRDQRLPAAPAGQPTPPVPSSSPRRALIMQYQRQQRAMSTNQKKQRGPVADRELDGPAASPKQPFKRCLESCRKAIHDYRELEGSQQGKIAFSKRAKVLDSLDEDLSLKDTKEKGEKIEVEEKDKAGLIETKPNEGDRLDESNRQIDSDNKYGGGSDEADDEEEEEVVVV